MTMRLINVFMGCLLAIASTAVASTSGTPERVVSLGGSVTEIVYELGKEDLLVGNDLSSIYPVQATRLPRVGYYRSLPLEGLLSLAPDLILASEQAGPPSVVERIQSLGVSVKVISDRPGLTSLYERIQQIAVALKVPDEGQELENRVRMEIEDAIHRAQLSDDSTRPVRAIVLMKRSSQMQAAGSGTTAAALLQLAGLDNATTMQQGYKPLSAEGLTVLAPDLIITTTSSIEAMGGPENFETSSGVSLTPAAQQNNILIMDDLLILGMGPRTAQALRQLTEARNKVRDTP